MLLRCLAALLVAVPAIAAPAAKPAKEAWDRTAPHADAAWVRSNAVPGRPAAGYLTITGGGAPDKLVAVSAPGLRIELHSMTMDGGVLAMAKLAAVPVPAGATVALAPGGKHLMIFGITGAPKTVPLTLTFGSGAKVTTVAEVRSAGEPTPADMHAMHGQP